MRYKTFRSTPPRLLFSLIGLVAAALSSSCSSSGAQGSLIVDWTVNATKDPALCDQNIGWAVVELKDGYGRITANHGPCHAFTTEFGGAGAGHYTLSAYLLNAGDDTTLSSVAPMPVEVSEDLTNTVSFDFPITVAP
jgi:hypothetical protein